MCLRVEEQGDIAELHREEPRHHARTRKIEPDRCAPWIRLNPPSLHWHSQICRIRQNFLWPIDKKPGDERPPRRGKRDGLSRMRRAVQGLVASPQADQRETVTLLVAAFPMADALMLLPERSIRLVERPGDVIV